MSISTKVRQKRYKLKENSRLQLVTEKEDGKNYSFNINDLSLRGLSVTSCSPGGNPCQMVQGELLPASKIVGNDLELPLGRLVFRHSDQNNILGFSCVDIQLPIDGIL